MQSVSGYHRINGIKLFVHRFRDPDAPPAPEVAEAGSAIPQASR